MMPSDDADIRAKSHFLTSTLHEMRTPIQTIVGTLELLSDTNLDKEQKEYVRQIRFSTDVLLSLANDVLDISKLQSGKFKIENIPYNIKDAAEQVVDLISIEAHNRGLEIITDIDYTLPDYVLGDPMRTQQILLNLLKNAVKFTSEGLVRLQVTHTSDTTKMLFNVYDTGIGVPEEKQKYLFNDYYQVDSSTTRQYGGTGLGLSISRSLVKMMRGEIGMKSNQDGGSIFWFSIPLDSVADIPVPKSEKQFALPEIPNTARILIVDDNGAALASLKNKLLSLGAKNIDTSLSGQSALEKLRAAAEARQPYTIAFIDMIMPAMDGWRLSAEINNNPLINHIKLFLMVPEGQMGGEAKMKMLDWFNGYIYKPIKRKHLADIIQQAFTETMDLEAAGTADIISDVNVQAGKSIHSSSDTSNPPSAAQGSDNIIASGRRILIAEDHPVNRSLLRTFLTQLGAHVTEAENGADAVEKLIHNPDVELIFMDIQMPFLNGTEASLKIRQSGYEGIIIACTANTDESDIEMYRNSGMNDTLLKPFKKKDIASMIEKWMPALKEIIPEDEDVLPLEELEDAEENDTAGGSGDIWNYRDLIDILGNDYALGIQLIIQYTEQTQSYLFKSREALYIYNFQSLAKTAHTLKGSSAAVSAHALSRAAAALEDAALHAQYDNAKKSLDEFALLFSRFNDIKNEILLKWQEQI